MDSVNDSSAAFDESVLGHRQDLSAQLVRGGARLRQAATRRRSVLAHTELTRGREAQSEVGLLIKGWACRYRVLSDGRRQILDVHLPGDLIGLDGFLLAQPADFILALSDLVMDTIDHDKFQDLMAEPDVSLHVFAQLAAEKRRLDDHLAMVGQLFAEEKIAALFLELYKRLLYREVITGQSFHFPLTQLQLGDFLGMTVVHVNRVLRRLRQDGIVDVKHRVAVIYDLTKLAELAAGRGDLPAWLASTTRKVVVAPVG